MKRRDFTVAAATTVVLGQGLFHTARAQAAKPEAGADYLVLDKKTAVEAPSGKVEVVEFFWYNCPHCASFDPPLLCAGNYRCGIEVVGFSVLVW